MTYQISKREDGYWIEHDAEGIDPEIGPYGTKAEAEDALRGLKRFIKICQEEGI